MHADDLTGMRLWVDDERPPPDSTWVWAKTAPLALTYWMQENVTELSLDHDLGDGGDTRELARNILGMAQAGQMSPPRWYVHSANPVGAEYLTSILEQADRHWRRNATQKHLAASYAQRCAS